MKRAFVDIDIYSSRNKAEDGNIDYQFWFEKNIEEKLTKANLKNGILTLTFVEEKIKSPLANLKIEVD